MYMLVHFAKIHPIVVFGITCNTHDVIDRPQSVPANCAAVQVDMHASGASAVFTPDANEAITPSHPAVADRHAQNFRFIV